jgi:hypothetical protein
MSDNLRSFRCAVCGLTYRTDTPEADINREFLNSGITSGAVLLSACDTCYGIAKSSRGESRE